MKYEYIEVLNKSNIKLNGMMINNNKDKCIVFIPGFASNFFNCGFARFLMNNLSSDYDFMFTHNQGSFQIMNYKHLLDTGKWENKIIGSAFEDFNECIFDLDAWVNYAASLNKKEIILIGHSRGCNKIVHYLANLDNNLIKRVILLSPKDLSEFDSLDMHKGMHEEAIKNINESNENKLLNNKFLNFAYVSSKEYLDLVDSDLTNNIPYLLKRGNFNEFEKINKELFVIIGTKDGGQYSQKYMEEICKHSKNCIYRLIEDADHMYNHYYEKLYEYISEYLIKKN